MLDAPPKEPNTDEDRQTSTATSWTEATDVPFAYLDLSGRTGRRFWPAAATSQSHRATHRYPAQDDSRSRPVLPDRPQLCRRIRLGTAGRRYRNILEQPEVSVEVGNSTIPVTAEPLAEDVGAEIFARYAARRPRIAAFALPRVLGMSVDGSDADFRAAGRRMPFVRLTPRS